MNTKNFLSTLAAALLLALPHQAAAAIDPATVQKLLAEHGAENDRFGNSVAVSGDTAVIGAYKDDDKGNRSG